MGALAAGAAPFPAAEEPHATISGNATAQKPTIEGTAKVAADRSSLSVGAVARGGNGVLLSYENIMIGTTGSRLCEPARRQNIGLYERSRSKIYGAKIKTTTGVVRNVGGALPKGGVSPAFGAL